MDGATGATQSFLTPPRILVPKLVGSRDGWKAKATDRKKRLKVAHIRVRDLENSREGWRQKAGDAANRIAELERQLAQVEQDLVVSRSAAEWLREELKKK
jgi:hypothetical protein